MDRNRRKTLAVLGGIGLTYAALRTVPTLFPKPLDLVDMPSPPGFRKYVAGESSVGRFEPFAGISADAPQDRAARQQADARVRDRICGTLFAGKDTKPDRVPIASFSDYYCPFCRIQTKTLAAMEASPEGGVAIAWHELPLFGEISDQAARTALAAKRQGAYVDFHARLMRSGFAATPDYISALARDLGVDEARLIADMHGPSVAQELADSAALSRLLGLYGTPALVIGRTVVLGQVEDRIIQEIVELERAERTAGRGGGHCGVA